MRTSYVLIVSAAAAWATMLACSGSGGGNSSSVANSTETSLRDQLVGTWTDASYTTDGAPFQGITLSQDGSFSWTAPCVSKGVEDCLSVRTDSGKWTVALSGPQLGDPAGASQLKLKDQFNQETDYFVQASSGTMTLSTQVDLGASYTFSMVSSSSGAITADKLAGAWTDPMYTSDGAPFQGISLNKGGTFSWTAPCVSGGVENCESVRTDSGNWTVGLSGPQLGAPQGATQLKLVDQFSQETDYFVRLSSGNLVLSTAIDLGSSYTFTRGALAAPSDAGADAGGDSNQPQDTDGGSGETDGGAGSDGESSGDDGGGSSGDDGGTD